MPFFYDQRYTTVAEDRQRARRHVLKLQKNGYKPNNIEPFRGKPANSFWANAWIRNFETFCSDDNRLARARRYLHNGLICDVAAENGKIEAQVLGGRVYQVRLDIKPLRSAQLQALRSEFAKNIMASLDLMAGNFSPEVMKIACDAKTGLLPKNMEHLTCSCDCPDYVPLCKHVLAVFYALAMRMDRDAGFVFKLRSVDPHDLIPHTLLPRFELQSSLPAEQLSSIFGVDIDLPPPILPASPETPVPDSGPQAGPAQPLPSGQNPARGAQEPPFDFMNPSGAAIRYLRALAGLDRWEMAKKIKASVESLERWENSEKPNMLYDSKVKIWKFQKNLMRKLEKEKI